MHLTTLLKIFLDNQCLNMPCKNNGNCTQTMTGFNCSCPLYYTGPTCQTCKKIKLLK